MIAYEQDQHTVAEHSSTSPASCPNLRPMCWELYSFLKLYGETGALVLRWFKGEMEQLLSVLAPLDVGKSAIGRSRCRASAQAAAYRAYLLSVVKQQLLLLDGCDV
jgi:hypothetical protein